MGHPVLGRRGPHHGQKVEGRRHPCGMITSPWAPLPLAESGRTRRRRHAQPAECGRGKACWPGWMLCSDAMVVLGFPFAVVRKYGDDGGWRHAALITYYGFLSVFPILLVAASLLSAVLVNRPTLREEMVAALLPPALQSTVNTALAAMPVLGTAARHRHRGSPVVRDGRGVLRVRDAQPRGGGATTLPVPRGRPLHEGGADGGRRAGRRAGHRGADRGLRSPPRRAAAPRGQPRHRAGGVPRPRWPLPHCWWPDRFPCGPAWCPRQRAPSSSPWFSAWARGCSVRSWRGRARCTGASRPWRGSSRCCTSSARRSCTPRRSPSFGTGACGLARWSRRGRHRRTSWHSPGWRPCRSGYPSSGSRFGSTALTRKDLVPAV